MKRRVAEAVTPRTLGGRLEEEGGGGGDSTDTRRKTCLRLEEESGGGSGSAATRLLDYSEEGLKRRAARSSAVAPRK